MSTLIDLPDHEGYEKFTNLADVKEQIEKRRKENRSTPQLDVLLSSIQTIEAIQSRRMERTQRFNLTTDE